MKSLCRLIICIFIFISILTACSFDFFQVEPDTSNSTSTTENTNGNESVATSRKLSFSDFETTPNNGGKYYKIPDGTREVIVTDLPMFKKIRLVRVNTSNNALTNIGTVQLSIYQDTDESSRSVLGSDSIDAKDLITRCNSELNCEAASGSLIENIVPAVNSTDDFTAQNLYQNDEPYEIPFVDHTDYESLLYDSSFARSAASIEPTFIVSEGSATDYIIGSTKQFNVPRNFYASSYDWYAEPATVRAVGTYCYIWVADANYSDSAEDNDNKLTSIQAQALAQSFDSLYEVETALIGDSYTTNPYPSIYINPQRKISIFIYDINGDYTATQTKGTFGLFWANDFYKKGVGSGQISKSNELELLYIDSNFADKYPSMIISTISHEFEHMLFFIHKTLNKGIREGSVWYKEMGAMMAEDLLATYLADWYDDFEIEYDSVIDRLRTFNSDYYKGGILDWKGDLSSYARSGIFGCWLLRNYGGADLFRNIIDNDYADMKSLETAIKSLGSSDTLGEAFSKYAISFVQPNATQYTLKKSVQDDDYCLVEANPWNPAYRDSPKLYNGPVYTSADYSEAMQPYGFWITGWVQGTYTAVKLEISEVTDEQNYLVIID